MLGTIVYSAWMAEAVLALAILLRDVYRRDWFRCAGLLIGALIGFWQQISFYLISPAFSRLLFYDVFVVPIVLTVAFGLRRRWMLFLVALVVCAGPIVSMSLMRFVLQNWPAGAPEFLIVLVELNFLLVPILAVLSGRELGAWIGSLRMKERPT